ncbi:uncharacterized protein [Phaseolus vulgaris]|uniref:uncharacterized protein n=1 Tax=Phaseolus vulgaris TaxID=3885 RepID=UPI0035CB64AE
MAKHEAERFSFISMFDKLNPPYINQQGKDLVSCAIPQYTPMSVLRAPGFDTDYLVDVIEILTGVGTERELNRTGSSTKADGFRMECTLFGNYVDELNAFLSSGELQNMVINLQFAKVKIFHGMCTDQVIGCDDVPGT